MDLEAAFEALPGLTERAAQRRMAAAVAEALEAEVPLLVHAPTGVGKSLGYLVPIVAAGRRTIVATATKALQSQLVERDLPRLADAFGTTSALAMGRGNYACYARIEALVAATRLAATREEEAALEVAAWAVDSETGSRLDAPPGVRDDVWDLVSTSGEDCPGQRGCAFFQRCFAERAREQARDVDVVVTNHHLLLLELELRAMSDAPGVMLPEADVIVVDEAHRLADHAADLYGVTVTAARMGRAGAAADAAAKAAGMRTDWSRRLRGRFQELAADLYPGPVLPGGRAHATLATLRDRGDSDDEATALVAARRRLRALARDLGRLTAPPEPDAQPAPGADLAVWVEEGRAGARVVRSALVEPGPVLDGVLWSRVPATVACSATLAVAGSLAVAARTLGVAGPATVVAASPFDFRANALLYVPKGVPQPSSDGFQAAAERELVSLVGASRGRALVLCTSWRAVESFAAALAHLPYELLVQGDDVPARLAARFRDEVASVLVATRTFFEGFDVPGESLSLLVLDRLPFPRPDDPLLAERGRRVEAAGACPTPATGPGCWPACLRPASPGPWTTCARSSPYRLGRRRAGRKPAGPRRPHANPRGVDARGAPPEARRHPAHPGRPGRRLHPLRPDRQPGLRLGPGAGGRRQAGPCGPPRRRRRPGRRPGRRPDLRDQRAGGPQGRAGPALPGPPGRQGDRVRGLHPRLHRRPQGRQRRQRAVRRGLRRGRPPRPGRRRRGRPPPRRPRRGRGHRRGRLARRLGPGAAAAAVGAGLGAVAAGLHGAPAAGAVLGPVVEGPLAGLGRARLEPFPGALGARLGDPGQEHGQRAPAAARPGPEHGAAVGVEAHLEREGGRGPVDHREGGRVEGLAV